MRIHAIYDKSRNVLSLMGGLFAFQIIITAICCGFYRGELNRLTVVARGLISIIQ